MAALHLFLISFPRHTVNNSTDMYVRVLAWPIPTVWDQPEQGETCLLASPAGSPLPSLSLNGVAYLFCQCRVESRRDAMLFFCLVFLALLFSYLVFPFQYSYTLLFAADESPWGETARMLGPSGPIIFGLHQFPFVHPPVACLMSPLLQERSQIDTFHASTFIPELFDWPRSL